jgi:hypothetical protein
MQPPLTQPALEQLSARLRNASDLHAKADSPAHRAGATLSEALAACYHLLDVETTAGGAKAVFAYDTIRALAFGRRGDLPEFARNRLWWYVGAVMLIWDETEVTPALERVSRQRHNTVEALLHFNLGG